MAPPSVLMPSLRSLNWANASPLARSISKGSTMETMPFAQVLDFFMLLSPSIFDCGFQISDFGHFSA
jgi:hypothetical protein